MNDPAKPASFDPERFFELARRVGHGMALGLEYRASGDNWMELCLPWREELVGVPETGVLASGAIVSLIDTASGGSVWMTLAVLFQVMFWLAAVMVGGTR